VKRILVTGSRDWNDFHTLFQAIVDEIGYEEECVVIHGGARGADNMAKITAMFIGAKIETHVANWEYYGRRAGFVRNAAMVAAGADVCLAFIRNNSRGASMCAELAAKAGIPVKYYRIEG
jgi:hypothetical protein